MTERNELINDIQKLKAERNRLLKQIKDAERWESAAWDSYNALTEHLNALEKKQKIARDYWSCSQRDIQNQFEFVVDQANKIKKVLKKQRYDLLEDEINTLMKEIQNLADVLGIEIDELPQNNPFFMLSVEEIDHE